MVRCPHFSIDDDSGNSYLPLVPESPDWSFGEPEIEDDTRTNDQSGYGSSRSRSTYGGNRSAPAPGVPVPRGAPSGSDHERNPRRWRLALLARTNKRRMESDKPNQLLQDLLSKSMRGICFFGTSFIMWFLEVCVGTARLSTAIRMAGLTTLE